MDIYHGSIHVIEKPEYGKGRKHNDYGRGFYCTQDYQLAGEWACQRSINGCINKYSIDEKRLAILEIKSGNVLPWLALLLEHRTLNLRSEVASAGRRYILDNFSIDIKGYDMIAGYRADDSYFQFVRDFLTNNISLNRLAEAMKLGKLGSQIVIKSRKAFDAIEYIGSDTAAFQTYYMRYRQRDKKARDEYGQLRGRTVKKDDILMIDILREEMKADDPRLQGYLSE